MIKSKHRSYVPELLLNTLFFCILAAIVLQIFAATYALRQKTDKLSRAIEICQNAALQYLDAKGSMDALENAYTNSIRVNNQIIIYMDDQYRYTTRENNSYYLHIIKDLETDDAHRICIEFYQADEELIYSIPVCEYRPQE